MPIFKINDSRYKQNQIAEIKRKAYEFINPHLLKFRKIIKSITNSYPKFNKHYEIDDNPSLSITSDSKLEWSLTFSSLWDTSNDECSSEIADTATIDKIFEMEDKIIKELKRYCDENGLKINFTNDNKNWDDAGICCNMDINFLLTAKHESTIFKSIKLI